MTATQTITFGNVVAPKVTWRDELMAVNTAWDNLGQRRPKFAVIHRMLGTLWGTDRYFRTDARTRALTDYGIDNVTGEILRWNDPLGVKAPHASGPYDGPTALGKRLVTRHGLAVVNRDGISFEVAGGEHDPVSDVAMDQLARLVAFWADWCGVPYTSWPINPATGETFLVTHDDFAVKACPFGAMKGLLPDLERRVRVILREVQTRGQTPSTKPTAPQMPVYPVTPPTGLILPPGVRVEQLAGWFGRVTSNGEKALTYAFDATGPLSALWLAYGAETGRWPQLEAVEVRAGNVRWFRFLDGLVVVAEPGKQPRRVLA